jgi:Beta-propeller repeat
MKKLSLLLFFILVITTNLQAQSWQWGKRGGATDVLETISDLRQEEVYSIVTDSNKNIYILSPVGKNGLDVDGVTKTNYGNFIQLTDVVLASFACDGTYRWSKIIGGNGYDQINAIHIDNQDNIYIAGKFGSCGDVTYPPRIDNDVILSQSPQDCSLIFLAKYDSNGVLQWFKRPQPAGISLGVGLGNTLSKGFELDSLGNSYWLVKIPPGTYAEGLFTNTLANNNYYLFKYDSNGNFLSAILIDMQLTAGFNTSLQFYRNPYNGFLYFTSIKLNTTNTAVVAGQNITHTTFIACFNDLGQFQWVREDTATSPGSLFLYNLEFDTENNIYLGGRMIAFNFNSFLGLTIPGIL